MHSKNTIIVKKIINSIIALTIIFSSISITFAEEWYIEKLLDLNYWVEEYDLNLSEINYISFNNSKYSKIYSELNRIDNILKDSFMNSYRKWEYSYYKINWIVSV